MFFLILGSFAGFLTLYLAWLLVRYPHLRRMAWGSITAHKHTAILTLLGLSISTALIAMTLLANLSMNRGVELEQKAHFGNIAEDLFSKNQSRLDSSYFDEQTLRKIEELQGGGTLAIVSSHAALIKKDGNGDTEIFFPNVYAIGASWKDAVRFDPQLGKLNKEELSEGEALLSKSAAAKLEVQEGDSFYVLDAANEERRLTVKRVVQEHGLTGYRGIFHGNSTMIVSPGTARALSGVPDAAYTNILLDGPTKGAWKSVAVRENHRREQKDAIGFLTVIFGTTSIGAAIIGIVLMTNIFKMIAEERRQEMGILRAIGLGKRDLRRLLLIEGLLYGCFSGLAGVALGWTFAYALIQHLGRSFLEKMSMPVFQFVMPFDPLATLAGYSVGIVIVYICVLAVSRKAVRVPIIEALQGASGRTEAPRRSSLLKLWFSVTSVILLAAFVYVTAVPDYRDRWITDDRIPFVFLAVFLFVLMLVAAFAQWLPYVGEVLLRCFRFSARATQILRLAVRNMSASRLRTGLLVLMFATISCFISFPAVYKHAIDLFMERSDPLAYTGGHELAVRDGRRLDSDQILRSLRASESIKEADRFQAAAVHQLLWREDIGEYGPFSFMINGIDSRFAESNEIGLLSRDPRYSSDREAWRALADNEDYVIVAQDALRSTGALYRIGDPYKILVNGKSVTRTLIGIAEVTGYYPEGYGIWTTQGTLRELAKDLDEIHSTVFINIADESDSGLAQRIEKALTLQNLHPVTNIVESENGYYLLMISIIVLLQNFNMVALSIGMVGMIVILYRVAKQRRHQIGLLRSIGIGSKAVLCSFLLEGAIIAATGILLGFAAGTYMSYIVFDSLMSEDMGMAMTLPMGDILGYLSVALALSFAFSYLPAKRTTRVSPIEATRYPT